MLFVIIIQNKIPIKKTMILDIPFPEPFLFPNIAVAIRSAFDRVANVDPVSTRLLAVLPASIFVVLGGILFVLVLHCQCPVLNAGGRSNPV